MLRGKEVAMQRFGSPPQKSYPTLWQSISYGGVFAQQIPVDTSLANAVRTLTTASDNGSIIGQPTLGYCYEKGIGVEQSTAGSRSAALSRLHPDGEVKVPMNPSSGWGIRSIKEARSKTHTEANGAG